MSTLGHEEAIDEALRESFPASDAPAWTPSHAGGPAGADVSPRLLRDVVQGLQDDVHFLAERPSYFEERFAALDLPTKTRPHGSENVEAVILGTRVPNHCVVVGAGIESAADVALLFSLARGLRGRALGRTLRLVALGDAAAYVDDLVRSGPAIDVMLGLERLGRGGRLSVVSAGRLPPLFRPGGRACHHLAFARRGVRSMMLTDVGQCRDCDYERLGVIARSLEDMVCELAE